MIGSGARMDGLRVIPSLETARHGARFLHIARSPPANSRLQIIPTAAPTSAKERDQERDEHQPGGWSEGRCLDLAVTPVLHRQDIQSRRRFTRTSNHHNHAVEEV